MVSPAKASPVTEARKTSLPAPPLAEPAVAALLIVSAPAPPVMVFALASPIRVRLVVAVVTPEALICANEPAARVIELVPSIVCAVRVARFIESPFATAPSSISRIAPPAPVATRLPLLAVSSTTLVAAAPPANATVSVPVPP